MNESLMEALKSLVLGMSTVFCGLLMLLLSMKSIAAFVKFSHSQSQRKLSKSKASLGADSNENTRNELPGEDEHIVGEALAAITMALRLDDLAVEDMEEQNLTWTRMFKPFSPWVMDSKTSLHTHRIRYRAPWKPGNIVRNSNRGEF
jgi:Na+-transporting methylmalonyl-CoA/oxaloacetate decarboxylase gamma subunit